VHSRQTLGAWGEAVAASWLEQLGYRLLARNHRCRGGEVDLVAEDGECVCFVEVRTRRSSWVAPAETIDAGKRRRVVTAAKDYLVKRGRRAGTRPLRFDAVEVQLDRFEGLSLSLHRNAFDALD